MTIKETVLQFLKEIKPTINLENVTDIIDGGYLDSLGIMALITQICDRYNIEMDIDWITPDNFNSVDAIVALIERLKSE